MEDDISSVEEARNELRAALRACQSDTVFAKDLQIVDVGIDSYLTLIDFAVLANDVEKTAELFERLQANPSLEIEPERLEYGGVHLENASVVESGDVVRWLLEQGFDPNLKNDVGATPLFLSQVRTEGGLRATRDLVAFGADTEVRARFNLTPMMFARVNGDLRKIQCLLALGARVPGQYEYSAVSLEESKLDKVKVVDDFLASRSRYIPKEILEMCTLDTSSQ